MKKISYILVFLVIFLSLSSCIKKEHTHDYTYKVNDVPSTCSIQGYTEYFCECGESYKKDYKKKLEHTIEEWKVVVVATEEEDGTEEGICTICKEKITRAYKHVHVYDKVIVVEPTCESDGYTMDACNCGKHIRKYDYVEKLQHDIIEESIEVPCTNTEESGSYTILTCTRCEYTTKVYSAYKHNYIITVIEPTCKSEGYTIYECIDCNYVEKKDYTGIVDHKYKEMTVEPTCLEGGYTIHECIYCEESYKDSYKQELGHKYIKTIIEATCIQEGYYVYTCEICSYQYTEKSNLIPRHNYVEEVIKPTCTEQGYTLKTCKDCGKTLQSDFTDSIGHTYGEWKVTIEATEESEGLMEKTCSICGNKETKSIAKLEHIHDYNMKIIEPTCTEQGYTLKTCKGCGKTLQSDFTDSIGHSYGDWKIVFEATEESEGLMGKTCSICGNKETKSIAKLEHIHDYNMKIIEPTCTEQGYTKYICACGDIYTDNYTSKLSHSYTEKIVQPTCTADGYTKHTCVCGDTYYDNYVSKVEHEIVILEKVNSSCTKTGLTQGEYCLNCDYRVEQEIIPALGHYYSDWEVSLYPTYETTGYKTKTCTICNNKYNQTLPIIEDIFEYEQTQDLNGIIITGIKSDLFNGGEIVIPESMYGFKVTEISSWAFYGCTNLTSVIIPGTISVISWYSFGDCTSLESVIIQEGVKIIEEDAFTGCINLKKLRLPSSVEILGESQLDNLEVLELNNSIKEAGVWADKIKYIYFPYGIETVSLKGCNKLETVYIQTTVKSLEVRDCVSISSLELPTGLEKLYISNCNSISELTIPNTVERIEMISLNNIASLEIPESVVTIDDYAFQKCEKLEKVVIKANLKSLSVNMFMDCISLTEVILPDTLTELGNGSFLNCDSLTTIKLPNSLKKINSRVFMGCNNLTDIVIPNNVTVIESYAFQGCNLENITIGQSVEKIGYWAFYKCKMERIIIPVNVDEIDEYAFYGCDNLKVVLCRSSNEYFVLKNGETYHKIIYGYTGE